MTDLYCTNLRYRSSSVDSLISTAQTLNEIDYTLVFRWGFIEIGNCSRQTDWDVPCDQRTSGKRIVLSD